MRRHFMKRGDSVLEGDNYQNDSLFSFSINRFQSFFISKMNTKESLVEKLQKQYREKLQKLKEEQKRLRKQQNFANILPLQSRSPKKGLPFPSPIYSSSYFQKSSPISKFERAFEVIRKKIKL